MGSYPGLELLDGRLECPTRAHGCNALQTFAIGMAQNKLPSEKNKAPFLYYDNIFHFQLLFF